MSISVPASPKRMEDRARRALNAVGAASASPLFESMDGGAVEAVLLPELVAPIPIFAPDISEEKPSIQDARQTGWRYLVTDSDAIGAVDVDVDEEVEPAMFENLEFARRIASAASEVEARVDEESEFEFRILDLNLIGDSLLWLASDSTRDRYFTFGDDVEELSEAAVNEIIAKGAESVRAAAENEDDEAGG